MPRQRNGSSGTGDSYSITSSDCVDNADEPKAIDEMKASVELSKTVELLQNKYFNRVEQDYRFIKRLIKLRMSFTRSI